MTPTEPTQRDILNAIQILAVEMDTHFTSIDGRFSVIANQLDTHGRQFMEIKDLIATSHDQIINRLERVEQEMAFTHVTLQRHEEQLARV